MCMKFCPFIIAMATSKNLVLASIIKVHCGHVTYPACTACYTKLLSHGQPPKYHCPRCQKLYKPNEIQHRYRLHLSIADQGTSRDITIFGSCLDLVFGCDATTFERCLKHAEEHHGLPSVAQLLQESETEALVGHPFYFGFKSLGHVPKASELDGISADPCFSLAKLNRNEENLVAMQMISPLQKWAFPTVMQILVHKIGFAIASLSINQRVDRCEGCISCPLYIPDTQRVNMKTGDSSLVVKSACIRASNIDLSAVTPKAHSATSSFCVSSGEITSTFGGTSVSVNMPSLRLSCDEYSLSRTSLSGGDAASAAIKSIQDFGELSFPRMALDSNVEGSSAIKIKSVQHGERDASSPIQSTQKGVVKSANVCRRLSVDLEGFHLSPSKPRTRINGNVLKQKRSSVEDQIEVVGTSNTVFVGSTEGSSPFSPSSVGSGMQATIDNTEPDKGVRTEEILCRGESSLSIAASSQVKGRGLSATIDDSVVTKNEKKKLSQEREKITSHATSSQKLGNDNSGCESYMEHWLLDSDYDWSFTEHLPSDHSTSDDHQLSCASRQDQTGLYTFPERSHQLHSVLQDAAGMSQLPEDCSSAFLQNATETYDFPEDLPFSEDLDQFLQDIEDKYLGAKTVKNVISCTSHNPSSVPLSSVKNTSQTSHSHVKEENNPKKGEAKKGIDRVNSQSTPSSPVYCGSKRTRSTSHVDLVHTSQKPVIAHAIFANGAKENIQSAVKLRNRAESICKVQYFLHSDKKGTGLQRENEDFYFNVSAPDIEEENVSRQCADNRHPKADRLSTGILSVEGLSGFDCSIDIENHESLDFIGCSQSPVLFSQSQSPTSSHLICSSNLVEQDMSTLDKPQKLHAVDMQCSRGKDSFDNSSELHLQRHHKNENALPHSTPILSHTPNRSISECVASGSGTPAMFSQSSDDNQCFSNRRRSAVPSGISSGKFVRISCQSKKASAPLRELFLQKSRLRKLCSTPRDAAKGYKLQEHFDSPVLFGTPDLFSSSAGPRSDQVFGRSSKRKPSSDSLTESVEVFEYTPDLF